MRRYTPLTIPIDHIDGTVNVATVSASWPMTPDQWDRMMLVFDAMRPGLVVDPVERILDLLSAGWR